MRGWVVAIGALLCVSGGGAWGQAAETEAEESLADLSLEELMDVQVVSVSKRSESRYQAPAAIFVITPDDIRRSGATNIPDLLRMVPGLSVARLDANKWSVTSRGFGGRYANKMLVLVDGRSAYSPHASGVYWESQNVMLEDVESIEVIRGPGGTLWGANAVNGVINVITKSAMDTKGGKLVLGGGTEERGFGKIRYGGAIGDTAAYRVFFQYHNRDEGTFENGDPSNDNWNAAQGGLRLDWAADDDNDFSFVMDAWENSLSETYIFPFVLPAYSRVLDERSHYSGVNAVGRWRHRFSDDSELQLQLYYEMWKTRVIFEDETRETFDVDLQHHLSWGDRHDLLWGLDFRYSRDSADGSQFVSLDPGSRRYRLLSGFIQDEITLIDDELRLTLGSKFEYNDFSGFEYQPNARIVWTPNAANTLWAAVSRGVRTPSRSERDVRIAYLGLPFIMGAMYGSDDFDSERMISLELGYRISPTSNFALDIALFRNYYDDLRSIELGIPFIEFFPLPPHLSLPFYSDNNMSADTYGAEISVDWRPKDWWRVVLAYTFLEIDIDLNPLTLDIISGVAEDDTPEQQVYLRNSFNIGEKVELDLFARYVDRLPALNVDDYLSLDVRLAWRPKENLELALVGQNLVESERLEFRPTFVAVVPTQAQRGVYAKLTWTF